MAGNAYMVCIFSWKRTAPIMFDWYAGEYKWLPSRTIFLTRFGSRAYGTSRADSDLDLRGVCVPPKQYFLGWLDRFGFEQFESKSDPDVTIYEVRKFFMLATNCNPSMIETLFTDVSDHLVVTPAGQKILDIRNSFLSLKIKDTFFKFAESQFKTIEHKLDGNKYNTKAALHFVRLMRMCEEILLGRGVIVKRPDAEELLSIRSNAWSFNKLVDFYKEMTDKITIAAEKSLLPVSPDYDLLDQVCISIVESML